MLIASACLRVVVRMQRVHFHLPWALNQVSSTKFANCWQSPQVGSCSHLAGAMLIKHTPLPSLLENRCCGAKLPQEFHQYAGTSRELDSRGRVFARL